MINSFFGDYRWLSNFYPCKVILDNLEFPTVEHAYQAAKTLDIYQRKYIQGLSTPGNAKRAGKFIAIRNDWDSLKLITMYGLLSQKFSQEKFRTLLLDTGDEILVEGNNWGDTYWGVCDGRGYNHLGALLMIIRMEARK